MQNFKLFLYSGSETTNVVTGSSLSIDGKYYSYDQSGLNQGVVTEFNVNQFLNNPNNNDIATDFFNYLTTNTTDSQFKEIVGSNKKLANIFTEYYSISVTNGQETPDELVDDSLTGTTEISVTNYNYNFTDSSPSIDRPLGAPVSIIPNVDRINTTSDKITSFTTEESFYIPVAINRNQIDLARMNFSEFSEDCVRDVNGISTTLTQCFVDLNKNEDSDSFWSNSSAQVSPNTTQVVPIVYNM